MQDNRLWSGRQLEMGGRVVELEGRINASKIPQISGTLPSDFFGDDIQILECDTSIDEGIFPEPSKKRAIRVQASGAGVHDVAPPSLPATKRFVTPVNFYAKPSSSKSDDNLKPL